MALTFAGRYQEAARAGATAYEGALAAGDSSMLVVLDSHVGYLHLLAGEAEEGLARCRSGLARLGPDSGERWQQSYLLLLEGICLFVLGDLGASAEAFGTALAMKHEIGDTMGMGYALEGNRLAGRGRAALHPGRLAAGRGRRDGGSWPAAGSAATPPPRPCTRAPSRLVRDALGEERYRALHEQGAAYPLEEIVRLAARGRRRPAAASGRCAAGPGAAAPLWSGQRQPLPSQH